MLGLLQRYARSLSRSSERNGSLSLSRSPSLSPRRKKNCNFGSRQPATLRSASKVSAARARPLPLTLQTAAAATRDRAHRRDAVIELVVLISYGVVHAARGRRGCYHRSINKALHRRAARTGRDRERETVRVRRARTDSNKNGRTARREITNSREQPVARMRCD